MPDICSDRPVLEGASQDAPPSGGSHEIEITPEMIEAGARALVQYDSRFDSPEEGAAAVFDAMLDARSISPRVVGGL
jgi:hypothetical protein